MQVRPIFSIVGLLLLSSTLIIASSPSEADARRGRGGNVNVNRNTNVNINNNNHRNRNVNVNVNNNRRYRNPVATGVAIGATVAVTAAVVGSMVHTLPPSCTVVLSNGISYQRCGSTWYAPQYAGNSVTYVVVNPL